MSERKEGRKEGRQIDWVATKGELLYKVLGTRQWAKQMQPCTRSVWGLKGWRALRKQSPIQVQLQAAIRSRKPRKGVGAAVDFDLGSSPSLRAEIRRIRAESSGAEGQTGVDMEPCHRYDTKWKISVSLHDFPCIKYQIGPMKVDSEVRAVVTSHQLVGKNTEKPPGCWKCFLFFSFFVVFLPFLGPLHGIWRFPG